MTLARKFRTAARLTSKPATPAEREQNGYDAGRRAAFAGRARIVPWHLGDDYAEGWRAGYSRVANNDMTGR